MILGKGFRDPVEGVDYSMAVFDDKFMTIEDFLDYVNEEEEILNEDLGKDDEEIEDKNDETFM